MYWFIEYTLRFWIAQAENKMRQQQMMINRLIKLHCDCVYRAFDLYLLFHTHKFNRNARQHTIILIPTYMEKGRVTIYKLLVTQISIYHYTHSVFVFNNWNQLSIALHLLVHFNCYTVTFHGNSASRIYHHIMWFEKFG